MIDTTGVSAGSRRSRGELGQLLSAFWIATAGVLWLSSPPPPRLSHPPSPRIPQPPSEQCAFDSTVPFPHRHYHRSTDKVSIQPRRLGPYRLSNNISRPKSGSSELLSLRNLPVGARRIRLGIRLLLTPYRDPQLTIAPGSGVFTVIASSMY